MCYGVTDLDVTDSFWAEADRANSDLPTFERIVASPLQRCQKLAHHIGAARGLQVETHTALIEMDFGRWEMTPWNAIPLDQLDAWADDFLHAKPHGGESVADLRRRVRAFLQAKLQDTLLVTHSGVIRAASDIFGHPDGWDIKTGYAEWVQF